MDEPRQATKRIVGNLFGPAEIVRRLVVADFMFVIVAALSYKPHRGNRSNHLYRISPIERSVTG